MQKRSGELARRDLGALMSLVNGPHELAGALDGVRHAVEIRFECVQVQGRSAGVGILFFFSTDNLLQVVTGISSVSLGVGSNVACSRKPSPLLHGRVRKQRSGPRFYLAGLVPCRVTVTGEVLS